MIFVRGNSLTRGVQLQLQEAGRVGVDAGGGPGYLAPRWHPMPRSEQFLSISWSQSTWESSEVLQLEASGPR